MNLAGAESYHPRLHLTWSTTKHTGIFSSLFLVITTNRSTTMSVVVQPTIGVMQTRNSRGRATPMVRTAPLAPAMPLAPPRPTAPPLGAPSACSAAASSATGKGPASQESVSISLIDLIEQLQTQFAGTDKVPRLQQLQQQATERPEEQVKLKRDILMLAGADALRAAVGALMDRSRAPPPPPPPPEPPLPSLWPADMKSEDFKATLIHSFHCRTPSCPVAGCASVTAKLQRLHQHVTGCETAGCLLCGMWNSLKFYREAAEQDASGMPPPSGAQRYTDGLLNSSQLLPRWQKGKVSWVMPQEAIAQVLGSGALNALPEVAAPAAACGVCGPSLAERACGIRPRASEESMVAPRVNDGPALKRRRKTAGMPPPPRAANGAAGVFPGMQGVLSTPATLAYLSSLDASGVGGGDSQQMQDMLRMQDIEYEAQMGGGGGAYGGVPMFRCGSSTLSLSGLPLSASFSDLGGASLADMLKSRSFGGGEGGATLAGLDMSKVNSFGLGSGAGLPIAKSRTKNASEMSLGTFLENTGGDLNDILNEFGPGGGAGGA